MMTTGANNRVSRTRGSDGFTLVELTMVCALLLVVVGIVSGFLIATNKAVATASVRLGNTDDSRSAVQRMASTIQFATELAISSDGSHLYALQGDGTTCDQWYVSGGDLWLKVGSTPERILAGVTADTAAFSSNPNYTGLVSVRFKVTENPTLDPSGTSVSDTFVADDIGGTGKVLTQSGC